MNSRITIKDCLDCHVVKILLTYIQSLFWNSISNLVLRFFLCSVCLSEYQEFEFISAGPVDNAKTTY